MKLFLISDTHAGCRNSSDIFAKYQSKFYKFFFEHIEEYKKENEVAILHLGDYYQDRKQISVKSLYYNRVNFLEPLDKSGVKMYIIPGNHDVVYRSTNCFSSIEEIMGIRENVRIIHRPTTLRFGNLNVDMIPWINSENQKETFDFIENSLSDICCGHFDFAGFEMHSGIYSRHGLPLEKFQKYKDFYSGHYHKKNEKVYLGAQFEMDWSDCDEPKYFHILDSDDLSLTAIQNPYTIFKKIYFNNISLKDFNFDSVNEHFISLIIDGAYEENELLEFIEKLNLQEIYDLKVQFIHRINESNNENKVEFIDNKEAIHKTVQSLELPENTKLSILEKMNNLYLEAMTKDEIIED